MKRLKCFGIVLAAMLAITACGSGSGSNSTTTEGSSSQGEVVTESKSENSSSQETETPTTTKGKAGDNQIVLGEPIEFSNFVLTIKEFKIISDSDGNKGLKYIYDWENTGDESTMPFMTFELKGFQDSIETSDDFFLSDDLDLGLGQKEVRKGGKVTAEGVVGIDDISKPLELELTESFSWNDVSYELIIEDVSTYE